jgi:hypothetical protein
MAKKETKKNTGESTDIVNPDGKSTDIVNPDGESTDNSREAEALKCMEQYELKEIWRCPKKGYWFSNGERANEYAKANGIVLQHFKK